MAEATGNMASSMTPKSQSFPDGKRLPNPNKESRYKIIVNEGGEKEPDFVFVGVNGVGYKLARGVEISVPKSVVHVLENAVQTVWTKRKDEQGREYMASRKVQRFPFMNLGEDRG